MDIEVKDNKAEISYQESEEVESAAFRVFDGSNMVYYASSRLGNVKIIKGGFIINIPEGFADKDFELIISGGEVAAKGKLVLHSETGEDD